MAEEKIFTAGLTAIKVKPWTAGTEATPAFNVLNPSVTVIQKMMGGTGTEATDSAGAIWKAPQNSFAGEYHVKIEPKEGYQITLPKVKLNAKISSTFGKTDLLKLEVTGTVLQPSTESVPKMTLEKPVGE